MTLSFPADPAAQTPANTYSPTSTPDANTSNDSVYLWDGAKWTAAVPSADITDEFFKTDTLNQICQKNSQNMYLGYNTSTLDTEGSVFMVAQETSGQLGRIGINTNVASSGYLTQLLQTDSGFVIHNKAGSDRGVYFQSNVHGSQQTYYQFNQGAGATSSVVGNTDKSPMATTIYASTGGTGTIGMDFRNGGADKGFAVSSNKKLMLGGGESTYFTGQIMVTTASGPMWARLNSEGPGLRLYQSTSSSKYKTDVRSLDAEGMVKQLNPVLYKSTIESDLTMPHGDEDQIGFIAEEVAEVHSGLATYDGETGEPNGVAYERVSAVAIAALKKANERIEALEEKLRTFKETASDSPA